MSETSTSLPAQLVDSDVLLDALLAANSDVITSAIDRRLDLVGGVISLFATPERASLDVVTSAPDVRRRSPRWRDA